MERATCAAETTVNYFRTLKKQAIIVAAIVLWLPAVSYGLSVMWRYATTPGHPAEPPLFWPAGGIGEREGHPTLLMFAHPQCECTRASLGELAILMARAGGKLDVDIFFYLPPNEDGTWARTDLWRGAEEIPGVRAFEDRGAKMAELFGVFTSGQTLLYGSDGLLLFKGGITAFRGHSGDNPGRTALTTLLEKPVPPAADLPIVTRVFGCSLRGE
jgi:hypothetical protein